MSIYNDADLLSYIAMCVRMKLRKDEKSLPTDDERILTRIAQGQKALKELYAEIKRLENA